jgi:hypothetical protein
MRLCYECESSDLYLGHISYDEGLQAYDVECVRCNACGALEILWQKVKERQLEFVWPEELLN